MSTPPLEILAEDAKQHLRLTFFWGDPDHARLAGFLVLPKPLAALFLRALKHGARQIQQSFEVKMVEKKETVVG